MKSHDVFVAGEWVGLDKDFITIENPANSEIVSKVPALTAAQCDEAVACAAAALDSSRWSSDGRLRADVLLEWADRLAAHIDDLALRLTLENGKTLGEATYEVGDVVQVIRYCAGLARTLSGRTHALGPDVMGVVVREPMGVVCVISPWNWPVSLMVRDMAPALAAGNAVLCKPASQTSGICVEILRHLVDCAGLPRGILSMITGAGREVGQALIEHPKVDMIAFTGSVDTGVSLYRSAAAGMKKLALELGGKSPFVICSDADLDKAVPELVAGIFTTTSGQICTAPSRLLVEKSIEDAVCQRLAEAVSALRLGDGRDEATQVGPITTRGQYQQVMSFIEAGKAAATLVAGGQEITDPALAQGRFVAPTIFTDVPGNSPLVQEEIFGPVLTVQTFETDAEAVALANGTQFGLASAVFTRSLERAWHFSRRIKAGTVWVNTVNRFYAETEVGGYKLSGIGRMAGQEGLLEFTQTKHINFDQPSY